MNAIIEWAISIVSAKAASEGRALRRKDANNTGKDDLGGQALIVLSSVADAYIDDELSMNEALAGSLEELAAMIRNPANK